MKQLYPTNFTFTFRLLPLYRNTGLFLLIFLLNFTFGFGQNPETTPPEYVWDDDINLPGIGLSNPITDDITVATDTDSSGNIYTLTFGNGVKKRNPEGGSPETFISGNQFESPLDLAIDSEGNIYVADYFAQDDGEDNGKVKVYNSDGNYIRTIFTSFYRPVGLAIDSENNIYVAEYNDANQGPEQDQVLSRLSIYDSVGGLIDRTDENLEAPYRVAVDSNQRVFVSQAGDGNPQVLIFNSNLDYQGVMSGVDSPGSIVIDKFDFIHVIEYSGRVDFNEFLTISDPADAIAIAGDINEGIEDEVFFIKVFNPNLTQLEPVRNNLEFPLDIAFNDCTKMIVLNSNVDGIDLGIFGFVPTDLYFSLELFTRTPSLDTENPIANCKSGLEFTLENGEVTITAEEIDGGSTDNCEIESLELSKYTFDEAREHDIELTVTDAAGNTDTCETTIKILPGEEEETPPEANCNSFEIILDSNGEASITAAQVYDGNEDLELEIDKKNFTCADLGENDVILTVTDSETDLTNTCTAIITVVDDQDPVVNCVPDGKEFQLENGSVTIAVADIELSSSDNCGITSKTLSQTIFTTSGTKNITLTVEDAAGNIGDCITTIEILPEPQPPEIGCADIDIFLDENGEASIDPDDIYNGERDDILLSLSQEEFDCSNLGENEVTLTATDPETELTNTCTATITVLDNQAPIVNCVEDGKEFQLENGSITIAVLDIELNSSDNCGITSKTLSQTTFTTSGTKNITLTVVDKAGNSNDCNTTIEILPEVDTYNFECIGELTVNLGEDAQNLGVKEIPTSEFITSDTSNLDFELNNQKFNCEDIGTNTLTIRATNSETGEEYSCEVEVTVKDVGAPLIICPAEPITINLPEEGYKVEDFFENRISDNCNSLEELELVQDVEPGTVLDEAGTYTINLSATDTYKNVETCEITIKLIPENSAPIANPDAYSTEIDTPLNISAAEGVLANDSDPDGDALIAIPNQDVTGGTLTLNEDGSFSYVPDTGFTGSDTFTYFAFDGEIQVETTVSIVVAPNDSGAPVANDDFYSLNENEELQISAPGILRNDSDPEDRELVPSVTANTSNGTLELSSDGAFVYTPNPDFSGTDSFSYLVNNGEQNSNVATVTLSVDPLPNDAPVALPDSYSVLENGELIVNAPGVIENDYDPDGDPFTAILLELPTQGTIDFNPDGSFTYIPNSGYTGPDSFTYMLNDEKNFSNEVTVTITVNARNPAPQFEDCPTLIQRNVSTGECEALVMFDVPTASDDSGELTVNLISELGSGDLFPVGTTTVIYEATGENGETITCSFEVMVIDNISPNISCPGDQIENFDPETGFEVPNYESWATFSDNCGEVSFRQEPEAGVIIYEDTTVQLFAEDANEQVASCSFELQLTEANVLNIFCQIDQNVSPDEDCRFTLPDYTDTAEVSLPGATVTQSPPEGTVINQNTQVKLTATLNGGTDECFFMVNLVDNENPVANCVSGYVVNLDESGNATLAPEMLDNNSTDNCGIVSMALSQINFTRADIGEVPITLTVRDDAGNMDTCETTVEVVDEASGEFECRENVVVNLNENGEAMLSLQELYTGNASGLTLEASRLNFSCSDLGMVQIQLDYSGAQTGSCTINVEVRDEIPPFINTDIVELTLDNEGFTYLEEDDVLAENNCGQQFIYRFSKSVFNCEDVGLNTVNVEVEDANGNIAEKNIEVRVNGEACEIPDNEDLEFLFIYPNPNNGTFTIATPEGMQVEQVRVFDSRGRFILQKEYKDIARFYRMTIEGVESSVYTLQIFTNEGVVVKRVIISQ
ncbi:tandem-95 repeat protein [Salegentibacter mishustinae]|uniref:Ig-like domain-containing protein n=1 Tax=Salegentibacter mishustinae TaxID=270918 RepID=UPI001CE074D7|nr:Ig-like domain-containing protein [Salegentibacter mishustinae]UBZ07093.1 tandem-95 repeat protein [Salegentibacter mishustinae]